MKGFIKILVVIAVIYLGIQYYKSNYTEEGAIKKADEEARKLAEKEAARKAARDSALNTCRAIYSDPNLNEGQKWAHYQQCEAQVNATYGN